MRAKVLILGLICLFIFVSCDGLKNPHSPDLTNPYPMIQITFSELTSTYNSDIDYWSWKSQITMTEINGISSTITELMARVYYNRSWPLGETIYTGHWFLPGNGVISYNVAVISGENVDRIKVFFEAEDENGNHFSGAQNFYPGNSNPHDDGS